MDSGGLLLSLSLTIDYPGKPEVVRNVELQMQPGEILGLVGQSGSGKSTLALAILRLLEMKRGIARGKIRFQGRDLMLLNEKAMRHLRGRELALVLQSPLSSLNPVLRIGTQFAEAWRSHVPDRRREWKARTLELLARVSLPAKEGFLRLYPRQLSVGQAQRVLIAMAVLHNPALLIADEPTSALDVITQSEILQLFADLNQALNMSILLISHDLLSAASLCHRIAILHEGRIVECDTTEQIFRHPRHPYARRLIASIPKYPAEMREEPSRPVPVRH